MHLQHFFLSFFAVVLHDYNAVCTTKTSSVLVTHYFYGGVVVCAYQRFCFLCSCSLLFFHCRSFSPEWFSSNEIRLPSTSSVINVIVNIKNNVEKDRTLFVCLFFVLFFFFSLKVRAAMWFSSVAFRLPCLLIELFCLGVPLVRTDGRSLVRWTVLWLPNFQDGSIYLAMGLRTRTWSFAKTSYQSS